MPLAIVSREQATSLANSLSVARWRFSSSWSWDWRRSRADSATDSLACVSLMMDLCFCTNVSRVSAFVISTRSWTSSEENASARLARCSLAVREAVSSFTVIDREALTISPISSRRSSLLNVVVGLTVPMSLIAHWRHAECCFLCS
jgi:hypothetical protein